MESLVEERTAALKKANEELERLATRGPSYWSLQQDGVESLPRW